MAPNTALKMAIFEKGLTQFAVAERAHIHETRLSKIVRGRLMPSDDEQARLAKVLRKPKSELFPQPEAVAS